VSTLGAPELSGHENAPDLFQFSRVLLPKKIWVRQLLEEDPLFLAVDGGGTRCRARLHDLQSGPLGEGLAGPANIRFGVEESFSAVLAATRQSFAEAGLPFGDMGRTIACLALAGASEPSYLAAACAHRHPFRRIAITTDAHAACVGAHGNRDGGVIVVGTGSIGWGQLRGKQLRVGGWGFPSSDEGSGAWIGGEALRRALWAHDGRIPWTHLLRAVFAEFGSDPHEIVRRMTTAAPRDFARLAPLVVKHATTGDAEACDLMREAARHIDALATRLRAFGIPRIALVGGLASSIEPWLTVETREHLVSPVGDALDGALLLARQEARAMAVTE
jgi:glucosamine kinase